MNQSQIKEHIRAIKKSIIYLNGINKNGAVTMAKDDLKHYETLLNE